MSRGASSKLLYNADAEVGNWVSERVFGAPGQFDNFKAIGITLSDKLIAGVVFNNMLVRNDGTPYSIEASIAAVDKRWATRHNLKALFAYPFIQLGLERLQAHCSVDNEGSIKILTKVGFTKEGILREYNPLGGDSIAWSMLKKECRWLS